VEVFRMGTGIVYILEEYRLEQRRWRQECFMNDQNKKSYSNGFSQPVKSYLEVT